LAFGVSHWRFGVWRLAFPLHYWRFHYWCFPLLAFGVCGVDRITPGSAAHTRRLVVWCVRFPISWRLGVWASWYLRLACGRLAS
jgi:hypothetical protein